MGNFRIGPGYDAHRFSEGRELVLGGVKIDNMYGLLGHSDADVLVHSVIDALLGAAALGDIGKHFPDTDEEYRGISSMDLLKKTAEMLKKLGYYISNIDVTLVMQSPKISPYISDMIKNVSATLDLNKDQVNIKATTEEKMGFTGRGEGASSYAVALIAK